MYYYFKNVTASDHYKHPWHQSVCWNLLVCDSSFQFSIIRPSDCSRSGCPADGSLTHWTAHLTFVWRTLPYIKHLAAYCSKTVLSRSWHFIILAQHQSLFKVSVSITQFHLTNIITSDQTFVLTHGQSCSCYLSCSHNVVCLHRLLTTPMWGEWLWS